MKRILHQHSYGFLILIIVILASVFTCGYFFLKTDISKAYAPPPASTIAALIRQPAQVNKTLSSGSQATNAADTSSSDRFQVLYNDSLRIEITYSPGDEDPKEIERIVENFQPNKFKFRSSWINVDEGPDQDISPDDLVSGEEVGNQLVFNNINLVPSGGENSSFKLTIILEPIEMGETVIESGSSRVIFADNSQMDLSPGYLLVRERYGPIGDVYAHGDINEGLGVPGELDGIDVIGAEGSIDSVYNGDHKVVEGYTAKKDGQKYRTYYNNLRDEVVERIVAEKAIGSGNVETNLQSSGKGVYYHNSGLTLDSPSGSISVQDKKVLIVDGNLTVSDDITYTSNLDDQLVVIALGNITFENSVGQVSGHYVAGGKISILGNNYTRFFGSLTADEFEIESRRNTIRYDSRAVNGLYGIRALLNPQNREVTP